MHHQKSTFSILTYNLGLVRIMWVDLSPFKWRRGWEAAARALPQTLLARASGTLLEKPAKILARLLETPLWILAPWVDERAQAAPDALRTTGADIVCLQEIFEASHIEALIQAMREDYPYYAVNRAPKTFGISDGLLILSKFPIGVSQFTVFRQAPWEEALLMGRGILWARIDPPDQDSFYVVNTHPTAGAAFRDPFGVAASALRSQQIQELTDMLKTFPDPARVVLTGDMNCSPSVSEKEYQDLLSVGYEDAFLTAPDHPEEADSVTFDVHGNPLLSSCSEDAMPSARIDHILIPKNGAFKAVKAHVVLQEASVETSTDDRVPVSDHYGMLIDLTQTNTAQEGARPPDDTNHAAH